ncbi:unnamed protein product [Tilletia controversa]|nr:unnamed protein product [Tilletia controversa]
MGRGQVGWRRRRAAAGVDSQRCLGSDLHGNVVDHLCHDGIFSFCELRHQVVKLRQILLVLLFFCDDNVDLFLICAGPAALLFVNFGLGLITVRDRRWLRLHVFCLRLCVGLRLFLASTFAFFARFVSPFIDALAASERISADIAERTGADVFAYSVFSVFFDQYSHLPATALQVLGGAALAIFAIMTLLLGSWRTGMVVTGCVASALLGVSAMMGVWGIGLNALTLVNLSVCAAICVEFCAHVARAFVRAPAALPSKHPMAQRERDERAWAALVDVGSSVLSGITGTKLVGISVLAFTRSELLKLYYANMWFALIILGALHGLVLLPVLLSYFGGRGYSTVEDESEVRRRLLRAQDSTEYRPFVESNPDEEDGSDDEL